MTFILKDFLFSNFFIFCLRKVILSLFSYQTIFGVGSGSKEHFMFWLFAFRGSFKAFSAYFGDWGWIVKFFWSLLIQNNKFHFVMSLFYWQTLSRSRKSKSESVLMTGFSSKSDIPTTQQTSQPATQESFKKARQSYTSKIKVISLWKLVPNIFLNLTPTPQKSPERPKKCKKKGPKGPSAS